MSKIYIFNDKPIGGCLGNWEKREKGVKSETKFELPDPKFV